MCVVQKARRRGDESNDRRRRISSKFSKAKIVHLDTKLYHYNKNESFCTRLQNSVLTHAKETRNISSHLHIPIRKTKALFLIIHIIRLSIFCEDYYKSMHQHKQDLILFVFNLFGLYVLLRLIDFNTWFLLDVEHFSEGEVIIFL